MWHLALKTLERDLVFGLLLEWMKDQLSEWESAIVLLVSASTMAYIRLCTNKDVISLYCRASRYSMNERMPREIKHLCCVIGWGAILDLPYLCCVQCFRILQTRAHKNVSSAYSMQRLMPIRSSCPQERLFSIFNATFDADQAPSDDSELFWGLDWLVDTCSRSTTNEMRRPISATKHKRIPV